MSSEGTGTPGRTATEHRPFVVELVGTPGAGKTTLATELVALLAARGFDAATVLDAARPHAARTRAGRLVARLAPARLRRPLLWQVFYAEGCGHAAAFRRERRALARHVLASQRHRPLPRARRRHILFWYAQLAGRQRFLVRTAAAREAFVVDDGFLHRAVHLYASHVETPDDAAVAAYVDLLDAPDLVVFVVASPETCARRVGVRGVWRHSRDLDDTAVRSLCDHSDRVARAAVARARSRGWDVVEIANDDGALERARGELERALDDRLGAGTRAGAPFAARTPA